MEPTFFLYDNDQRKFHPLVSGTIYGGPTDAGERPTCQFRILAGEVCLLDLADAGTTRVNGEALRWGESRCLALNDVVEVAGRTLVLTNRCVFGPGDTRDLTQVTDDATMTMTMRTRTPIQALAGNGVDGGSAPSPRADANERGTSSVVDPGAFYQSVWSQGTPAPARLQAIMEIPEDSLSSVPLPAESGLRLVSSVSLQGDDPRERCRAILSVVIPLAVLTLTVLGFLFWRRH